MRRLHQACWRVTSAAFCRGIRYMTVTSTAIGGRCHLKSNWDCKCFAARVVVRRATWVQTSRTSNFTTPVLPGAMAESPTRAGLSSLLRDHGAFKTPTLREITRTAPYMHDGSIATLDTVIEFSSKGGRPNPYLDSEIRRNFTSEEKRPLVHSCDR